MFIQVDVWEGSLFPRSVEPFGQNGFCLQGDRYARLEEGGLVNSEMRDPLRRKEELLKGF